MQPTEEELAENALRDNIKRKGQNSVSLNFFTILLQSYLLKVLAQSSIRECMVAKLFSRIFFFANAISRFQYYYAHANKNFNTDGAKHFEGDGKIYGGDPVLIRT